MLIDASQRADTGLINSSPVTSMIPYVILSVACTNNRSIEIPVTDADSDVIRCRCNYNTCLGNLFVDADNCIIYFNPTSVGYYAVEIQIEDFMNTASVTPLSSVPLVFLVNVISGSSRCCQTGTQVTVNGMTYCGEERSLSLFWFSIMISAFLCLFLFIKRPQQQCQSQRM